MNINVTIPFLDIKDTLLSLYHLLFVYIFSVLDIEIKCSNIDASRNSESKLTT